MITTTSGLISTNMATTIKWRLSDLMDRVGIKNQDLAQRLNMSSEAVSRMKNTSIMPRYNGDQIGAILDALNAIYEEKSLTVTICLTDLLERVEKQKNS